jgi:hypothetical protein
VLSTITVIHRIRYTYQQTKPRPVAIPAPDAATVRSADLRPASGA